jgi:hypothetical protein
MKTETITMAPMFPGLKAGDYLGGWSGTYKVLEITSQTTCTVRRLYWWERLRFWISDRWFMLTLDVSRLWRRIKGETP